MNVMHSLSFLLMPAWGQETAQERAARLRSRSIVIHAKADDMKTDPSGNSGDRFACGVI